MNSMCFIFLWYFGAITMPAYFDNPEIVNKLKDNLKSIDITENTNKNNLYSTQLNHNQISIATEKTGGVLNMEPFST